MDGIFHSPFSSFSYQLSVLPLILFPSSHMNFHKSSLPIRLEALEYPFLSSKYLVVVM